jgi:hypothetical protein
MVVDGLGPMALGSDGQEIGHAKMDERLASEMTD